MRGYSKKVEIGLMGIRTLIVDDNPVFCMELEHVLQADPFFTVTAVAHNGLEALQYMGQYAVDLMVLDGIMPRMDGLALLEELALQRIPLPKVAVVSALEDDALIRYYIQKGAHAFFIKPISLDVLAGRLKALCSHERADSVRMTALREDRALDAQVVALLHKIAVPPHVKGYRYLLDAISMVVQDAQLIKSVTTVLYPAIAQRHDSKKERVERSMRHAIELAWDRCRVEDMEELFGYTVDANKDKPTNSEFIAMLADHIRLQQSKNPA